MLVVRVELWPLGNESRKETLATMVIANDGTHEERPEKGNYKFWKIRKGADIFSFRGKKPHGEIKDYPRKSYPIWSLVKRALKGFQ